MATCKVTGRCDASTPPIEGATLQQAPEAAPMWRLSDDGLAIRRRFTAQNFLAALAFFNKAGEVAERHGHHPDLHLTNYRDVEVVLTTHHIGKLSAFDFAVASDLDALDVQYSKKWLKENPLPTAPAPPPAP